MKDNSREQLTHTIGIDKIMHVLAGGLVAATTYIICQDPFALELDVAAMIALGMGLVAGLLKEVFDKYIKKTAFDWLDVGYTFLGGGIPFGILIIFKLIFG